MLASFSDLRGRGGRRVSGGRVGPCAFRLQMACRATLIASTPAFVVCVLKRESRGCAPDRGEWEGGKTKAALPHRPRSPRCGLAGAGKPGIREPAARPETGDVDGRHHRAGAPGAPHAHAACTTCTCTCACTCTCHMLLCMHMNMTCACACACACHVARREGGKDQANHPRRQPRVLAVAPADPGAHTQDRDACLAGGSRTPPSSPASRLACKRNAFPPIRDSCVCGMADTIFKIKREEGPEWNGKLKNFRFVRTVRGGGGGSAEEHLEHLECSH